MTTVLLVGAGIAALACPLHMAWATPRGLKRSCCPAATSPGVDVLRDRQARLAAQIKAASATGEPTAETRS